MIADEPPERDRLAIPDTRPNMMLFIPNELAILFGVVFFMVNTWMQSMVYGFIVIIPWLAVALMVRRDMNGARVFMVRARLFALILDAHRWDGMSTSPWPLREKRHA